MKNIKDNIEEFFLQILVTIIFGIPFLIEEFFEISSYLLFFNILVLVAAPFYYLIYFVIEKRTTKKEEEKIIIDHIDFDYFRDIISIYSPGVLSFVLDGTEFDKDAGASIIYLMNKGYLNLNKDNTIVRTEKDCSNLSDDLKILCNANLNYFLAFRKFKAETYEEKRRKYVSGENSINWLKSIEKQSVAAGLVLERNTFRMFSFLSIICLFETIYCFFLNKMELGLLSGFVFLTLIFLKQMAYDKNKWVKTQKGYELYKQIMGLKNYIKDFSMLDERSLKEIEIWEDYLIYAIIFNDTSKLNSEAEHFYKRVCNLE